MEKRKKRFWSLILSTVMVIGLLWTVPGDGNAAAVDYSTIWKYSGVTGGVINDEDYVTADGQFEGGPTCKVTELTELISYGSGINISDGNTIGNTSMDVDATNGSIVVNSGATLICRSFNGSIINNGTFECSSISGSVENKGVLKISTLDTASDSISFKNGGTVIANKVILNIGSNSTDAVYEVSDSFEARNYSSEPICTVKANPHTIITSNGGGFNLTIVSDSGTVRSTLVSDSVDSVEAWTLMDSDSSVGVVKFKDLEADSDGKYYSNGNIVIVPTNSNCQLMKENSSGSTGLSDSVTLTAEDLKDETLKVYVVKSSDDYSHNELNYGDLKALLNLDNVIFDTQEPQVTNTVITDEDVSFTLTSGKTVTAKSVKVTLNVVDDNIDNTVTTSVGDKSLSLTSDGTSSTTTIEFKADPKTTKEHYYKVKDKAGNETELNFYLTYKKDKVDATVEVNDIYVEGKIEPTLKTDHVNKSKVKYYYKSENDSDYSEASIDTNVAGKYYIKAVIPASDLYEETSCTDDFEIMKIPFEHKATVTVTPTLLVDESGNYYFPDYIGRPDDWTTTGGNEKDIIVEYKATAAPDEAYSRNCPTTPGTYMVKATLPETAKYEKAVVISNSFEVTKNDPKQAVLIMSEEITVGDKFAPSLSTDSNGDVTYKCKPTNQTSYGDSDTIKVDDIITEAGEYNAKAFIAESDIYFAAESNEVTFKVNKKKVDIGVSVDDVTVGDPITVNLTPSFNPKLDVTVKYEYKVKNADDSTYTTLVPNKAGDYTVKATLTGSNRYEDATATADFTIGRKTPTNCSVNVADIKLGGTIEPIVTTDSDGKDRATFEYKKNDEPVSAYSDKMPTETGDYSIRATVPETDTYSEIQCEGSFSIGKIDENTAKVEVPDTVVGTDYTPILTTASDGKASAIFEYKGEDEDDSAYTGTKPTAPGRYMVRATVPETSNYKEQVCTATFTISEFENPSEEEEGKQEDDQEEQKPSEESREVTLLTATAKVEIPDVYVGVSYEPLLTTDSDGKDKAKFEYKNADNKDAEYSTEKPVKAGKYIVRVTIPATDKYNEVTCEGTFTISKITAKDSKIKLKDVTVGNSYNPLISTDSDGINDTVFEYKKTGADDSEYSKKKPTKVGNYTVRATVPKTDKYLKVVCESTFAIVKKTPQASVKLDDQFVGAKYNPSLSTDSDGKSKAYFEYKSKDASDDEYSKTKPVKVGEYEVRATIPETSEYNKATCKTEFSIKYLKENNVTYKVSGDSGKNGYYVSDVYIVAPKGYEISTSEDGIYSKRVKYTADIKQVYLRRSKDGAKTEKIEISQEIKIDKDAPKLLKAVDEKNDTVDISGAKEFYADKLTLAFNDEHLSIVKVNGDNVTPDDKDITLILDPEGGDKYYAIIVEDIAGNKYSANFVLKALWMKDNTLPSGSKVKLKSGNGYTLKSGSWKVDGDATVYSGGRTVYVNSDGDYTFVEQ